MSDVSTNIEPCVGCGTFHPIDTPCPDGTKWWHGMVKCRICSNRHVAVVPVKPDDNGEAREPVNTECPNCENMSCDPIHPDEGDDE